MRSCKNCYFYEQCGQRKTCESYTPLGDEEVTREERRETRLEKREFRFEWDEYLKRDDEGFEYADLYD